MNKGKFCSLPSRGVPEGFNYGSRCSDRFLLEIVWEIRYETLVAPSRRVTLWIEAFYENCQVDEREASSSRGPIENLP